MKRILVCALAAMILMASCLTAFATPSYTATTSYITAEDGTEYLEVVANVTDATAGDIITFLAYDEEAGATIEDSEVVYIDQKTVPANGRLTFNYNTVKENLTGVDLKFGTDGEAAPAGDANVPSRAYTVSYNGETHNVLVPTAAVDILIVTDLVLVEGEELATATYGGANVLSSVGLSGNKITIQDSEDFDGGVIEITSASTSQPLPKPEINNDAVLAAAFTKVVDDVTVETLSVFGYAVSDKDTDWGGIIVSGSKDAINAYIAGTSTDNVANYPAYHKSATTGEFAVQLVNETGNLNLTNKTLYVSIYVTNSTGTSYGIVKTFPAAE